MSSIVKIDCRQIRILFYEWIDKRRHVYNKLLTEKDFARYASPALEVHQDDVLSDKLLLDIRTYICAHGRCLLHCKRSHRRLSEYNWQKMNVKVTETINKNLNKIINEIFDMYFQQTEYRVQSLLSCITLNKDSNKHGSERGCESHSDRESPLFKKVLFVKESLDINNTEKTNLIKCDPIETIFNKIDKMAEDNSRNMHPVNLPDKSIVQTNSIRMTYGDLNYIGSNKAIFYFDRGIRGKQIFTNSVYSLKHQPPHKDLIVIDDIVFTSNCKCDSSKQHKQMFPHYRVTCAVGLTCPARLNSFEKIAFARDRNATAGRFTTARSMLIRFW